MYIEIIYIYRCVWLEVKKMIDALICFAARRSIYLENPFECFFVLHNIKHATFLARLKQPGKKIKSPVRG